MTVSVVIPTFNSAALVVEAVQSVLSQTQSGYEIIVVDDGSTDDTSERLRSLPIRLIRQPNTGVAMARNAGVAAATGEVIAFLDADDVWHPRKLELQLPLLRSHGLVATGCFDWPGTVPEIGNFAQVQPINFQKLVIRNCIVTSTVMVNRDVLRQAGEFDKRLQGPEDYDLWLRVARIASCATLPLPLTGYRTVQGSLSKNAARMESGMKLILEKLDADGAFNGSPLLRRKACGYFHYSCGFMHHQAGQHREARNHIFKSLLAYPGWYGKDDVRYFLGRLRLLVRNLIP